MNQRCFNVVFRSFSRVFEVEKVNDAARFIRATVAKWGKVYLYL
jgi:hypothetical protein